MHSSKAKGVSNGSVHIDGRLTIRCSGPATPAAERER